MSEYDNEPMSTASWFFTMLLLAIPLVNLILYIIWAAGVGNRSRVTFCRASMLWAIIGLLFYGVFFSLGVCSDF